MRVAIVAGEQSGDLLGAGLMQNLRQQVPGLEFEGIGGPQMQAAGCQSIFPMERLAVMGLFEVLGRIRELLRIRRELVQRWIENPPDLFVGIDAPDFNFALERRLKQSGIPTVHYVSPSVWAWRQYRVARIARSTDLMLTLFPFEAAFYEQAGVPVQFVGHPLADTIPMDIDQPAARRELGLPERGTLIAILPGSRESEVQRLAEPFLGAAAACHARHPDFRFVLPIANKTVRAVIEKQLVAHAGLPVTLFDGKAGPVMAAADALLVASGTATLEGLLYKRPMVVAYRLAAPTYWLVRQMLKAPWYSLPNLLAGQSLVPEITQNDVTPERLAKELLVLIEDSQRIHRMRDTFTEIHDQLKQGANDKAAQAVLEMMGRWNSTRN